MRTGGIFLCLCFALAGCSTINTGEIDYRRAERPPAVGPAVNGHGSACAPLDFSKENADKRQCKPLLPAKLVRKYAGIGDAIRPTEVYSIRLEQGLIAYIAEAPFSLRRLGRGDGPFHKTGEIVVLAQTFEFAESATAAATAGSSARFVDLTSLNDVRVIYYSPDVEQGQTLNFSNIPIQSPTKYGGRPIGIQIVVLELDRMSTPLKSLMNELAALGSSTSLVTGSPAAKILLDLGSSLLTKDNDDVIFDYRFVLDPSDGTIGSSIAPFEAGRYVMRRTDDRRNEQIWRNIELDHNTGRLVEKDGTKDKYTEFDDDTWFTINVIKHHDKTESFYDFGTFAELSDAIAADADDRDASFTEVAAQVGKIAQDRRSQSWAKDLGAAARNMATAYRIYGRSIADDKMIANPPACKMREDASANEALAKVAADEAALVFVETYARMLGDTVDGKAADGSAIKIPVTSLPDRRAALSSLASYFAPFDPNRSITSARLVDPVQFEAAYIADGGVALMAEMDWFAKDRLKAKDCARLIQYQLAD